MSGKQRVIHPSIFHYFPVMLGSFVVFAFYALGAELLHVVIAFWICLFIAFIYANIDLSFKKYYIHEDRVVAVTGILQSRSSSVRYDELSNVRWQSDFFQRVFGIGDVHLDTAGGPGEELVLHGVSDPERLADYFYNLRGGGDHV